MTQARHPQDPDPVRATKASAVLGLGVIAVLTGPLVGGVIPATLALMLARESRRDLTSAKGYLLGASRVQAGVRLAWTGIVLALTALTIAAVIGLLTLARGSGRDFAPTVN